MADYSTIHGFNVQVLSADPPAPGEGQVWYNTTTGTLKGYGQIGTGAWSSGGALGANYFSMGASGTQTAGLAYGGQGGNTGTYTYNGTSWTTSPATLNHGRHQIISSGIGTQGAAQCMGGEIPAPPNYGVFTEQFNGSAWTEVAAPGGSLNTGRYGSAGGGTQTAAILSMGTTGSGTNATETWNGSTWTTVTAAPQSKWYVTGGGTQSDFITAAGEVPPSANTSDYWNGSSWTEVANINTARILPSRGAGSGTSAIIFGGEVPPRSSKTEQWDGTTWTEVADLGTASSQKAGSGTAFAAFGVGNDSPNNGATEEWSIPSTTKTFSSS
tara:strand:- start:42 stop:1022 length:981 start_codon:yes stop_codon:yes gene_type:complete